MRWLETIVSDIRYGSRMLWKDRAAMAAAALSLALSLGACATAFALIDALLLRPLPVARASRLFYLAWPDPKMRVAPGQAKEHDRFSYPMFQRLRETAGSRLDLFGSNWPVPLNPVVFDRATGDRELVRIAALSGNGFSLLGIHPAAGRLLTEDDDAHSTARPVAVISHAFWTRRFGANPFVIGQQATIGTKEFEIVGVVEQSFTGLQPGYLNDLWIPLTAMVDTPALADTRNQWIGVWGHTTPDGAPAEQALQAAFTNFRRDYTAQLGDFTDAPLLFHPAAAGADSLFRQQFQRPLWIFGIFSGLLLLIAASNVANLLFARAIGRQREMALRMAIGAGRSRLVQQLLIESGLLAAVAVAGAIAIGKFAAPFLANRLGQTSFPSYLEIRIDWRTLAFMSIAGLLTTLFVGTLPALRASALRPDDALKASARQAASTATLRPLVAIQVGFSFMVLFLSGLLLTSFAKLLRVDVGFAKDHLAVFTLSAKGANADQLLDRLRRMNGVRAAGLSMQAPIGGVFAFTMSPFIQFPGRARETLRPSWIPVSPGFFETMRIPLRSGRDLRNGEQNTTLVNDAFAQRFFPGQNAVGQHFQLIGDDKPATEEIVGVVGNSLFNNLREPVTPTIYTPLASLNGSSLEVRTESDPRALIGTLRRAMEQTDPTLHVRSAMLQTTLIDDTLVSERLLAWLGGFFAVSAIVLVAVGLHGIIAWFVVRRTGEIGIRMALGAEAPAVIHQVVMSVATLICAGIVLGAASGIAVSRYATSLLFDVKPLAFLSLAAPVACILAASLAAALRPAMRAARIDPVIALRYE